eukprot:7982626-Pyramimonas_sp.AAC.1
MSSRHSQPNHVFFTGTLAQAFPFDRTAFCQPSGPMASATFRALPSCSISLRRREDKRDVAFQVAA